MIYKCIEPFSVKVKDSESQLLKSFIVPKDSLWSSQPVNKLNDAVVITLVSVKGNFDYVEMSVSNVKRFFELQ